MTLIAFLALGAIISLSCCGPSGAANILGVFPHKFKSHYIIYDSLMSELAKRGHNVTVISPFAKEKPVANFRDVDVDSCNRMSMDIYVLDEAYKSHEPFYQTDVLFSLATLDESILSCEPVRELLRSNDTYDLVIAELFASDTMAAFSQRFHCPLIWFSPQPLSPWAADRTANPHNPSYVTHPFSSIVLDPKGSTFYGRLYNTLIHLYSQYYFYKTNEKQELLKRRYFQFDRPWLSEMAKKTSLILTFSHFSISGAKPLVPNVIEVGGLFLKPVSPLPKNIEKFINESEHGVIYFCLGSLLKAETMSPAKINAFLNAFAKLPQRVLWKWGDNKLPGKTEQVFISKWMPQRDILAHPKVKLFIGHGGALGINEAVNEGVPILGIPMYADQTLNLKTLETYGAAEILEYTDINNETVLSKIRKLLTDSSYAVNMKKVSRIYRDRPTSPMDTAIYWVEYVIRHDGAYHLRSVAVDLPLYKYLLLDVIAFVCVFLFSTLYLVYFLFKLLTRKVQRSSVKYGYKEATNNNCKKIN